MTPSNALSQGPEGRPPNVSPARKGWVINPKDERRRRGTVSLAAGDQQFSFLTQDPFWQLFWREDAG
jgi:hypothetical protein